MKKIMTQPANHKTRLYHLAITSLALITLIVAPAAAAYTPTAGSISGTVMYYGALADGLDISVGYHTDFDGPPVVAVDIPSPGGDYSLTDVPPGVYFVIAFLDANGSNGPPDDGEPIGYYDSDGDGDPDTVSVDSGALTGIDIALNQQVNAGPLILYVDDSASGAGDGSCWHDAYTNLGPALTAASTGMEIWIAAGTYKPGTARGSTYTLKNWVKVFGGFAGDEILREERDLKANATILSGEINTAANTDNIYHVVTANSTNRTAVLSDVTIMRGYANDENYGASGYGGGMKIREGSPSVLNVRFLDNFAMAGGGGIEITQTPSPGVLVVNCTFSGNNTPGLGGAGILVWTRASTAGDARVYSSSFAGNTGTAMLVNGSGSVAYLYNTIVSGGLQILSGWMPIWYGMLSGACPSGATCYTGTLVSTNALFVDANGADDAYGTLDDDLRLQGTSPAVDSGDNAALMADTADLDGDGDETELVPTDLDGLPRLFDAPAADTGLGTPPIVDRGAYEYFDPSMLNKYLYLPIAQRQ